MSFAALAATIGSVSAIVAGVVYLVKMGVFLGVKTPAEKDADIAKKVEDEKSKVDAGGRPTWD